MTKKFCDERSGIRSAVRCGEPTASGPLIERRRAVTMRDRTQALLHIATSAAANYRREKQRARPARL